MPIPCELASKSIVPAMRASVARELSSMYRLKQEDIAFLMGVTQSAVSQYLRNLRGKAIKIEDIKEVQDHIKTIANGLVNDSLSKRQISKKYCKACLIVRKKRLLCDFHRRLDPTYNIKECDVCIPSKLIIC